MSDSPRPLRLDLKRTEGLLIEWQDGTRSFIPLLVLRRMSPSADSIAIRESLASNPLTVLKSAPPSGPLEALGAELVGTYALRVRFSDGHDTGLYSWQYLRELGSDHPVPEKTVASPSENPT